MSDRGEAPPSSSRSYGPGHFVIDLDEINQFRLDQENLNK
jgi:hypothetical protein